MEHTWKIIDLKRTTSNGVVFKVIYTCNSIKDGISQRQTGELELTGSDDSEGFIQYDNLKESDVLGWVAAAVDQTAIETANSASIEETINYLNTKTEAEGLPW